MSAGLGPVHHLEHPASGCFSQEQRAELADWSAAGHIAGRHQHGRACHRVRVWQPVTHAAAGDLADLGLVPPVLETHVHPVHLGYQQLGRHLHWLSCLLSLRHRGRGSVLPLGERRADLLGVGAHGLNSQPDAGQALQVLRRLLEWQFGAGRGHPRLQLSTQDLVGAQAEHLVGRDPAPLTRRAPVVRALEGGLAAHTHRLPVPPLVWPATDATLWTGRALPLGGRVIQPQRPFQHRAQCRSHDASEDAQYTLLVLGQRRLPMLNRPLLQLLGGFQQPRYDR